MGKLKTMEDLMHHQLKDLYDAEKRIIKALPRMAEESSHKDLRDAFVEHLEETRTQKERLEKIGKKLDIDMDGETCMAMQGLIRETKDFISEDATDEVRDAGLIADAQRIEHYEIAGYGTCIEFAKKCGHTEVAKILKETLDEEKSSDQKLTKLAVDKINEAATV